MRADGDRGVYVISVAAELVGLNPQPLRHHALEQQLEGAGTGASSPLHGSSPGAAAEGPHPSPRGITPRAFFAQAR